MDLAAGARGRLEHVVTEADTATALGSGDVPVLATPRLLAWLEAATVEALAGRLGDGETSVGSRIELEHRSATAVGAAVTVTADLVAVDGRLLRFSVAAQDADGQLLATGEVTRVVVDRERFLTRLPGA
jgi:fluoroacetyl-CoA thioesterase